MIRMDLSPSKAGWVAHTGFNDPKLGEIILTETFRIKLFALLWARREAKRVHEETGETVSLRIRDRKGRFQEERTYGVDPARSPG